MLFMQILAITFIFGSTRYRIHAYRKSGLEIQPRISFLEMEKLSYWNELKMELLPTLSQPSEIRERLPTVEEQTAELLRIRQSIRSSLQRLNQFSFLAENPPIFDRKSKSKSATNLRKKLQSIKRNPAMSLPW